jgi:hypothetical protein
MCIQFNINKDSDRRLLKENAKHFECEVFLKSFIISEEKVSVPIDPRIQAVFPYIILPQGQITPDYPLVPPVRDDKKEYRIGKVHFDKDGIIVEFAPTVTIEGDHTSVKMKIGSEYRKGYHAMVAERLANKEQVLSNLFEKQATYHQYPSDTVTTKTTEVILPVMLSDITAFDSSGEVAGRVMLIMSKQDYDTYNRDISSKPIVIKDKEAELCLN